MATEIAHAIRDGTFPQNETTLSSSLDATTIPSLLAEVDMAKKELSDIVRGISKEQASDVDGWIAQAKKVQEDIARCKEDARQIIEEHDRIETLRHARNEASVKVGLLQEEIGFNETLQMQIKLISETASALNQVDHDVQERRYTSASKALPALKGSIDAIPSDQARALLSSMHAHLYGTMQQRLRHEVESCWNFTTTSDSVEIEISARGTNGQEPGLPELLDALDSLGTLGEIQSHIFGRTETSILPHLHKRSRLKFSGATQASSRLTLSLSASNVNPSLLVDTISTLLRFLHEHSPPKIQNYLAQATAAKVIPRLVDQWLNDAIPVELSELKNLDQLQQHVSDLAQILQQFHPDGASTLQAWMNDIPKAWLAKRRMNSLDAVRKAFTLATGTTRHEERVERQTMEVEQMAEPKQSDEDWTDHWGDEDEDASHDREVPHDAEEDDSDAWGFETDDQEKHPPISESKNKNEPEDDADAWEWGDEDEPSKKSPKKAVSHAESNGVGKQTPKVEDVVLAENYTVTDLPDHILEQIGKDNADMQALQSAPQAFFKSSGAAPSDMQSLPALVLSMYRATAPSSYVDGTESFPPLSIMNLYNDTLYLIQKISGQPDLSSSLQPDVEALNKFARQLYSSELSTQRQILADLLDNAQGFIGCTRAPNSSVCETAVSSTVDYLRGLHKQWSSILSPSHLAQSVGSLLSSAMGKMIKDIEDMEDISEPESRKLLSFMEQISAMQDLFLATPPATDQPAGEGGPVSTIAVHVPSYLRFQYLQQILDSSLVDIKYLWTDAGLSLEFSADEVVDLIKALFAESGHRRSAIQTIKTA